MSKILDGKNKYCATARFIYESSFHPPRRSFADLRSVTIPISQVLIKTRLVIFGMDKNRSLALGEGHDFELMDKPVDVIGLALKDLPRRRSSLKLPALPGG